MSSPRQSTRRGSRERSKAKGQARGGGGSPPRVHFLDVGEQEYGDAILLDLDGTRILLDGSHPGDQVGTTGHPSIPEQLRNLLSDAGPSVTVDLLIVTHAHADHIGCLPYLVEHQLLAADWALVADPGLGWGRALGAHDAGPTDPQVANVVAALREEVPSEQTDDPALARFIADAATLEQEYNTMLTTLADRGTRVVRYGRDDPEELLKRFASVGLEILGPSQAQLLACAEAIAKTTADAVVHLNELVTQADARAPETSLYRDLISGGADTADAISRPGPAINLQSIVTKFECGDLRLLLGGDMQFANPQLGDPIIQGELQSLRGRIAKAAPFSLAKLSHHGSDNAFDASVLRELGSTSLVGICAGEGSLSHPNPAVLRLLDQERQRLEWVRTDHNGLASVAFNGAPRLTLARGEVSDPRPNTSDSQEVGSPSQVVSEAVPGSGGQPVVKVRSGSAGTSLADEVEILTKIPLGVEHISLSVDVRAGGPPSGPSPAADPVGEITIADGRKLPRLLFVTSANRLAANVGRQEAAQALTRIREAGLDIYDQLPDDVTDPSGAITQVREQLTTRPGVEGVVLLGGYDVVPSVRTDVLPPDLRRALARNDDNDDFIVWSDDRYGDLDGDRIAELPVSRIPDAKSAAMLIAGLRAGGGAKTASRAGVRNSARPFAEKVFSALPGTEPLAISAPTEPGTSPALDCELIYLMLHGAYDDSTRFWGEEPGRMVEAVNLTNIPAPTGRVVFTGCCWAALTVDRPAVHAIPGAIPAPKTVGASMALSFLANGASAFIGCTGSHYSPDRPPYAFFGGPMHEAFWGRLLGGDPPARALFNAKVDYAQGFPHGLTSQAQYAVEYKILRQYTCLGLGW
jgi:beta-lactamase superfamily II metal-dependent hydrolase